MSSASSTAAGRGDALVLFGATGDLSKKMLYPALYQLARAGSLPATVVGVALSDWRTDELVEHVRTSVAEHSGPARCGRVRAAGRSAQLQGRSR